MAKRAAETKDNETAYWATELDRAKKRWRTFWDNGDIVVDTYRLQKADGNELVNKDKYNILYSSTETIRPNLYAQQPKARVVLRSVDTANDVTRLAARLLEGCLSYLQQAECFDELMEAAVEDLLLPGLGQAWVRYEAEFEEKEGEGGTKEEVLLDEMVKMEYVYWQDFLMGIARTWKEVPWVARRLWLTKKKATKRFGPDVANKLSYANPDPKGRDVDYPEETAEAWEIWDKQTKTVYWYAEGLPHLLGKKADPLKLKNFFPCPRPLRAISNTRTLVPRSLYSQYKSQADMLNILTRRIRLLSEALRVVGVYDGSQPKIADLLNPNAGNRMIAVDSWAAFAEQGGIAGSVAWLPIEAVVKALNEVLAAREVCKAEIYEITGFSDIVRGVSKASETLGAQNIKANWASARVRKMQAEVQRFARDLLAIAGELVAEHCSTETIAIFSGIQIPDPADVEANPEVQEQVQKFTQACDLIRNELRRVSVIDIETDSTLLADETAEREDRTNFLSAAGAFLQQAVPAAQATPELGPLLGALLMFVVRTFPSSRPVEDEFEKVQRALAARGPQQQQDNGEAAAAQAQAEAKQAEVQVRQQEAQSKAQYEAGKLQIEAQKEQNRHAEKMEELRIEQARLEIEQERLTIERFKAMHEAGMREEEHAAGREDAEQDRAREDTARADEQNLERERMDRDDMQREADREASVAAEEARAAASGGQGSGDGGEAA